MTTAADGPPDAVLARAFRVLGAVAAAAPEPLGPTELAQATGLPKSTAFRMARQLVALGALQSSKRGYRIGLRLFELGNMHYPSDVREAVQPYMADLCRATGLTVQAGLLDGSDVAFLDRHVPRGIGTTRRRTEVRVPAVHSAAGKVILSSLSPRALAAVLGDDAAEDRRLQDEFERIRRDGYACEYGEHDPALGSIAVPLASSNARTFDSALELRGPREAVRVDELLSAARLAASAITRMAARARARPSG
jgi:DNA-binding IclR family transcriptional regulator